MRLAPHLFCWRMSLIDALSSYVKRMFINKLLCHNDVTLFAHRVSCRVGFLSFILFHYKIMETICMKFALVTQN